MEELKDEVLMRTSAADIQYILLLAFRAQEMGMAKSRPWWAVIRDVSGPVPILPVGKMPDFSYPVTVGVD